MGGQAPKEKALNWSADGGQGQGTQSKNRGNMRILNSVGDLKDKVMKY